MANLKKVLIIGPFPPPITGNGLSNKVVYEGAKEKEDIINDTIDIEKIIDEKYIWEQLKTCYDPEIPVNIVDLGLIYDLKLDFFKEKGTAIEIKMTLTAPGCGMGPVIAQDVETKVKNLNFVDDVLVEVVWDPIWNQDMMSEEAKLKLGML